MKRAWNHNTHYHRLVLGAAPRGTTRALDVGCGEGDLLADLSGVIPDVVGIDADAAVLECARTAAPLATLIRGDFLTDPLPSGSFDLVAAIAALHHMDFRLALRRIDELLRPGGVAVVIGIARPHSPTDYAIEAVGVVATRLMRLSVRYKEVQAPTVWPPPLTYAECRRIAREELPGSTFRRRLFFRYSLVWTKQPTGSR
jgi:SAM-dependent methyltransferase